MFRDADVIEIYYDSNNSQGGLLGEKILKQMILQTKANNRGVRSEDFAVTRETKMPSVLIELGYLSDIDERARLMEDNYRDLLARGIADGILAYLKE